MKKCKCKVKPYSYITGTPQDVSALRGTLSEWLDEGYGLVITLIGTPGGGCGPPPKTPC